MKLFCILKHAVAIVLNESFPMSSYLPICYAVKAGMDEAIAMLVPKKTSKYCLAKTLFRR